MRCVNALEEPWNKSLLGSPKELSPRFLSLAQAAQSQEKRPSGSIRRVQGKDAQRMAGAVL